MWKPVTIKPNDQSFEGKIVQKDETLDEKIKILRVADYSFFGKSVKGGRESIYLLDDWLIWEEDKPKKLLAPALTKAGSGWMLTNHVFENRDQALEQIPYCKELEDFVWPAIPNKDGYYEVSE